MNYKTIQENKVNTEIGYICQCFGEPGINCFTGRCNSCGLPRITVDNSFQNIRVEELIRNGKNCKNGDVCFCDGSCKKESSSLVQKTKDILSTFKPFSAQKTIKTEDILKLNRYILKHNEDLNYKTMEVDSEGEYLRLKDVLNLL